MCLIQSGRFGWRDLSSFQTWWELLFLILKCFNPLSAIVVLRQPNRVHCKQLAQIGFMWTFISLVKCRGTTPKCRQLRINSFDFDCLIGNTIYMPTFLFNLGAVQIPPWCYTCSHFQGVVKLDGWWTSLTGNEQLGNNPGTWQHHTLKDGMERISSEKRKQHGL